MMFTDLQHGFRTGRSCETQLITIFHDIAFADSQIDIAVLDFSKAFDTVPHDDSLSKSSTTALMTKFGHRFLNFYNNVS